MNPSWISGFLLCLIVTLSTNIAEPGPPTSIALQNTPGLLITQCSLYTQRTFVHLDPWDVYCKHIQRPLRLTEGRLRGTQTQETVERAKQTTVHILEQLQKYLVTEEDLSGNKRPKRFLGALIAAASAIRSLFSHKLG